jgi:mRNA interferase MazF
MLSNMKPYGGVLHANWRLMVDKITTRTRIGYYVGRLADEDIVRPNRAVLVSLGVAGPAAD